VRQLYLREYIERWDAFISDIRLIRASRLEESLQQARDLSAPDNPLAPLMRGIARETTLVPAPESQGIVAQVESRAKGVLQDSREQLSRLLFDNNTKARVEKSAPPEQVVDDHFASLHAMVKGAGPGAPAPLDNTIALIGEVYNTLNVANLALRGGDKPPPSETPAKVSAEAARLPEPLRSLLTALSKESQTATLSAERSTLSKDVNSSIGQFCSQAIEGRYPLSRSSDRDVALDDFTRVFAPGGLFDDFFTRNLAMYVDTTSRPWTFRKRGEATMGADSGTLLQFERAAAIRTAMFRGGREPSMKLQFTPYDMDPTISEFNLDVDGQQVQWKFGPKIPVKVQWPGPRGGTQVRLSLSSDRGGSSLVKDGPWALFHLFDRMQVDPVANAPERFRITFNLDGRRAIFDVDAGSVQNPFTLRELREFHCPTGL
jgi:type VI secretion system protein ImpL